MTVILEKSFWVLGQVSLSYRKNKEMAKILREDPFFHGYDVPASEEETSEVHTSK